MLFTPKHAPISSLLLLVLYIAHDVHKAGHSGIDLRLLLYLLLYGASLSVCVPFALHAF